jgi:hyperosmotically inducible protein
MGCKRIAHVVATVWLSLATILIASSAFGQSTSADNTKRNSRDHATSAQTADQQRNNRSDVAITQDIRRAIVADKTLSTYAHNVKVITQHGEVTLKGPVRNEEEKKVVEAKALEVAGTGHVKSEISVTGTPAKSPHK